MLLKLFKIINLIFFKIIFKISYNTKTNKHTHIYELKSILIKKN